MTTNARTTQLVTEVLDDNQAVSRNTQLTIGAMHNSFGIPRNTQMVVEVLFDVDYFSVMSYDSVGEIIFGSVVIR